MLSKMSKFIDVIVPRGGKGLVAKVQKASNVHVIGHLEGLCHIYLDEKSNLNYAKKIIQKSTGNLKKSVIIPHGVSDKFRVKNLLNNWPKDNKRPIRCLYVSNIAPYKHQWHVVRAVKILRDNGFNLELNFL